MTEGTQETYLSETGFGSIIKRGLKKLLTELTSVKSLLLAFVCVAISKGWVGDYAGLTTCIVLAGARELPPIDQLLTLLKGGQNAGKSIVVSQAVSGDQGSVGNNGQSADHGNVKAG